MPQHHKHHYRPNSPGHLPESNFPGVTDGPAGTKHLMTGFPGAMDNAKHLPQLDHHHARR